MIYDEWKAVTTYRLMYRNEKNAFKETQVCKAFKLFILKQKKHFITKLLFNL